MKIPRFVVILAVLLSVLPGMSDAATCVRMLGGPGPQNAGDIKFSAGPIYGAGGGYTDEYSGACNGRRVYFVNASMLPFNADNTVVVEDLFTLAEAASDGAPYALSGSWTIDDNATFISRHWSGTDDFLKRDGTTGNAGDTGVSTAILKGDGAGGFDDAVAGTDYVEPSGNAATATALAANPSDCSGGQFATGINADGTAVCDTPAGSGDMLKSVYDTGDDGNVDMCEALSAQFIDWNSGSGGSSIANKPSLGTLSPYDAGTLTDTNLCTYDLANTEIDCNTPANTYQPLDAELTSLSTIGADKVITTDGSGNIETTTKGTSGLCLKSQGPGSPLTFGACGSGAGDVVGPSGATDNAVAVYDTTTGKLLQDSPIIVNFTDNSLYAPGGFYSDPTGEYWINIGNSSDITPSTEGQMWWNTTDDVAKYYDGTNPSVVMKVVKPIRWSYPSPTASSVHYFEMDVAFTVTSLKCWVDPEGTGESISVTVKECDGNGDSCADGGISVTAANTPATDLSFTDAVLDKNDIAQVTYGTPTGTITSVNCTLLGRES